MNRHLYTRAAIRLSLRQPGTIPPAAVPVYGNIHATPGEHEADALIGLPLARFAPLRHAITAVANLPAFVG
jgi:hypothetical protein